MSTIRPEQAWHFFGILLFVLLFAVHRWTRSKGVFVAALWNLTGVILHESAHLVAGILLGAKPSSFSLIPSRTAAGWSLGSVRFTKINPFNAVPVALAPLVLTVVAWGVYQSWPLWFTPSLRSTLALYAALFVLLYNALPSRQDLRVACNWKSILLYGAASGLACWFA